MSALQAIKNPKIKSAQQIIYAILQLAKNTKPHGIAIRLQWMPGQCEEPGNDTADQLAREAAMPGKTHPFAPLLSREKAFIRRRIYARWEKEWKESRTGSHLRRVDHSLPAKYTRRLYGPLPRNRAYLLTQLRTGHCLPLLTSSKPPKKVDKLLKALPTFARSFRRRPLRFGQSKRT